MKNFLIAALLFVSACAGSTKTETAVDSTAVAIDTVAVDTAAVAADTTVTEK